MQYFLKALYLYSHSWGIFDLINSLYNLSLTFIDFIIPFVTHGVIFFFFSLFFVFFLFNQMLLCYSWKRFIKMSIKVVAVRHSKWKVFQKHIFHLTSTIYYFYGTRQKSKHNLNNSLYFLVFFQISFLLIFVLSSFLCFLFHLATEAGTGPATLLKNRPWHRCLSVNFVKLLRTPFLQNTSGQLLL